METYKYLGISELDTIKHAEMKEKTLENAETTENQTISPKFH